MRGRMSFFWYQFMKVYHHSWGRSTEENFFSQEMIEKSHGSIHHARCVQVWEMTAFFLLSEAGGRGRTSLRRRFFCTDSLVRKKEEYAAMPEGAHAKARRSGGGVSFPGKARLPGACRLSKGRKNPPYISGHQICVPALPASMFFSSSSVDAVPTLIQ